MLTLDPDSGQYVCAINGTTVDANIEIKQEPGALCPGTDDTVVADFYTITVKARRFREGGKEKVDNHLKVHEAERRANPLSHLLGRGGRVIGPIAVVPEDDDPNDSGVQ